MKTYKILLFVFLFAMYFPMIYLRNELFLSLIFFLAAIVGAWLLKKVYSEKFEPVSDERIEKIDMKSVYYASIALLVIIFLELLWLENTNSAMAFQFAKLLIVPILAFVIVFLISKEVYSRKM